MSENNGSIGSYTIPRNDPKLGRYTSVDIINPHHDWVLLEMINVNTTPSGIVLNQDEERYVGVVRKHGPGRISQVTGEVMPVSVKEGQIISLAPDMLHGSDRIMTDDGTK